MNKVLVLVVGLLLALAGRPVVHAEYDNIKQTDVGPVLTSPSTVASGTWTSRTFKPLPKTFTQSAVVQATGTSPNYKVEVLCSMDGVTFTKPEVGGDLGTFTDQNPHFVAIQTPLSPGGHQFKFTELGGVNSVVWTAQEASQ